MPNPKWVPILHRDVKPDNVLLRSRATLGSNKYFYSVLSDFGLACDDRDDRHSGADKHQVLRVKLGTKAFWAPELCYEPYPRSYPGHGGDNEWKMFPNGHRHTRYSDLWALVASVFNLCALGNSTNALNHLNLNRVNYIPG
jgi:serine/threonine protein kinase